MRKLKSSEFLYQTVVREFIGGLTTFLTMSYIVVVNPSILSSPGTGMSFSGVMTATVLLCFSMTLLMGLYAKLPFAVAPGMGINAFFTYTLVIGSHIPWQTALGCITISGVLFFIASVTPIRTAIVTAIPDTLKTSASVGIGIFLAFIGFKNSGLIAPDPNTFIRMGKLSLEVGLSIFGIFIAVFLFYRKSPLAFIISILVTTVFGVVLGKIAIPTRLFSAPDFHSVFFKLDIKAAMTLSLLPAMISIFFTDLFDSISTFVGVAHATGLTDKNASIKNLKEGLIVDSLATFFAGIFGTSSGTAYIESAAGIEAGARTGLSSVFTALLFLPCLFISPLVSIVPSYATAPVLIVVGCLMFRSISKINFSDLTEAFPAFLTIVLIPLTFSITQGILWGFVSYTVLKVLTRRHREVSPALWAVSILSLLLIIKEMS